MVKVPSRNEIQAKIDALVADSTKNKEDYEGEIKKWLEGLNLPPVVIAGEQIDPIAQILGDLDSYNNY